MSTHKTNSVPDVADLIHQVKNSHLNLATLRSSLKKLRSMPEGTPKRTPEGTPKRTPEGTPTTWCPLSSKTAVAFLTLALFFKFWIHCFSNISEKECLIDMPIDNKDLFRPAVDCSMCRQVDQVDIVQNLSPENFSSAYAYSGRPVVVTDALVNWTAKEVFTLNFFRELYENYGEGGNLERCQFFRYKTEFRSLGQALSMSEERKMKPWYFGWSNCDSETAEILRQHYSRPYFLPENSESSRTDWIFVGTAGLGAHMHVDHVGLPSWQAQIRGKKLWLLEPPPECFYDCKAMQVVVNTGDTIVLDTNIWYHKTSVVSDEVSITIGSEYD